MRRLLALTEFLGMPTLGEELEFPLCEDDFAHRPDVGEGGNCKYVCIHPGASVPERCWPPANFAVVAKKMVERGFKVVVTGTAGEADLAERVGAGLGEDCVNLAGRTDLGPLAAVLRDSSLLICNDTGVSHVAAALKVPSVVISTGNNPERWAPADRRIHTVLCRDGTVSPREVLIHAGKLLAITGKDTSKLVACP